MRAEASSVEATEEDFEKTDEYGDNKIDKPPHALYSDYECAENDVYAQEFFMHSYAVFITARRAFYESREGHTFIRMSDQERLARRVVTSLRGPCGNIDKWNYKMEQMKHIIVIDSQDVEFLDVDQVLYSLLYEYKNQRGAFQKSLEREFMKHFETFSADAVCDFETFDKIIESCNLSHIMNKDFFDPLITFAGHITKVRAYVFAITAGL